MFNKSFISIYFLPNRVLILRLSANKNKVIKNGQVILPEGLIKDYRIQNSDSLSKVISSAWSKLRIKEKVVGIVIPEFSTFSKCFKLPKLSVSEIDEAVRWQAQEYLPEGLENMILDWKITNKDSTGVEVLTVAVEKEVLSEYIEVIEKAGLFPMKVETPSICLLRYIDKEKRGTMIIYRNFGETILVVSDDGKIIGTSIQHTDNLDIVLRMASKMLDHYSDVKVEEILIGGEGIKQDFEKISAFLKRKVRMIDPKLDGIGSEEIQKNLIPISLQFEEAEQPADPTTLNLLPASLVDKYKFERIKIQVWSLTLTITLFVWLSFLVTLGSYLIMSQNINDLKAEYKNVDKLEFGSVSPLDEIESINKISQNIIKIKNITVLPQVILNEVYSSKPLGITIMKYDLDLDKGEVRLQGVSVDRKTLIKFKENLEKLSSVDKVEIPISSFEAETNLDFSLAYLYLPIKNTIKEKQIKINPIR